MSATIDVMYNACYGGFSLSDAAMAEYRRQCPNSSKSITERTIPRHDRVMTQIVREMGQAASGTYAKVELYSIPAEYENYYGIYEYDGTESVFLKKHAYKLSLVRSIMKDQAISETVKLARIATIVDHEEPDEPDTDEEDNEDHDGA